MTNSFLAGVARNQLTPPWGVELAGWGYYLGRIWQRVRDHTAATALVIDDGQRSIAVIAVDLMYADADFCKAVRDEIARHTTIAADAICIACSHSHSTPTAGKIRGAGEIDRDYVAHAARQAATVAILAWKQRRAAQIRVGSLDLPGWTYNRTREGGPVDTRLGVWRVDDADGRPLAALVNFQGHPVVQIVQGPAELSRDVPGQVTDVIESALPGVTALYVQGACGDLNFDLKYHTPQRCHEPGLAVAAAALTAFANSRPVEGDTVGFCTRKVKLPTRRWEMAEVQAVREECEHRLKSGDTTGWLDGFARVVVNFPAKLPSRYEGSVERAVGAVSRFGKEWADETLVDLASKPEWLMCEAQALRVGDAWLAANGSEFFSSLALEVRRAWGERELLIAGYANESIGYLPDEVDVQRRTYAAYQSPKFKGQFPFTEAAGRVMVGEMVETLTEAR